MPPRDARNDPTELVILALLNEEPLYGYAITKRVATRSEGEFTLSPGVLYPLLNSLERQKMIVSTWETSVQGRPPAPSLPKLGPNRRVEKARGTNFQPKGGGARDNLVRRLKRILK